MVPIQELQQILLRRAADSHKGTFGTVLLIGGSYGMTGAMAMAGKAALRSGAGLVRLAVPRSCVEIVAGWQPEYTVIPLPEDSTGKIALSSREILYEAASQATVAAIGPGLGQSEELDILLPELWHSLEIPMVWDADSLHSLARTLTTPSPASHLRMITPHPGEFAHLSPQTPASNAELQRQEAVRWAARQQAVVVLKGTGTLITDGTQQVRNETGNPGMGTGGCGDILTGILASFLAQLLRREVSPFDIARLAVFLHGRSGDLAAEALGEVSLIASDLIRFLPDAIRLPMGQLGHC